MSGGEYDLLRENNPELELPPRHMLDEPTLDKMRLISADDLEGKRRVTIARMALLGQKIENLNPRT